MGAAVSTVEGRVALVTGASSGIGTATAQALSAGGAKLALASRRADDVGIDGALARPCDVRRPEHLEEMIDTNVKGLLYTVRAALPHLLDSDSADLVVVASVAGQRGPEGEAVYSASKFAQVGFMRSLDHELYRRGVRCSTIAPGGVHTEFAMGRGRTPQDPDLADMMRPQEVADAVVHAVTRPRTHRVLEATILPMSDDSMN